MINHKLKKNSEINHREVYILIGLILSLCISFLLLNTFILKALSVIFYIVFISRQITYIKTKDERYRFL